METLRKIIIEELQRLTEMTDTEFVIDQLVNNVADGTLNRNEFIDYLSHETKFNKEKLGKLYDTYHKLDGRSRVKLDNKLTAKKFLKKNNLL